jgi:hypothetical protein
VPLLLGVVAVWAACGHGGWPATGDGGADQRDTLVEGVGEPQVDRMDARTDPPTEPQGCGGTVSASGGSPLGTFTGSSVEVSVVFVCRRLNVVIVDGTTGRRLAFALLPASDGGGGFFGGSQTVTAVLTDPSGVSRTSSATVDVTMADDPFTGHSVDVQPAGQIDAMFSLSQDGFSITGSFATPYCIATACGV